MRKKEEKGETMGQEAVLEEVEEDADLEVKQNLETKKEKTLSDLPGVGPATVEKLQLVGYNDLMAVAVATPGELMEVTGMNQSAAKKVIAAAISKISYHRFK